MNPTEAIALINQLSFRGIDSSILYGEALSTIIFSKKIPSFWQSIKAFLSFGFFVGMGLKEFQKDCIEN